MFAPGSNARQGGAIAAMMFITTNEEHSAKDVLAQIAEWLVTLVW